MYISRFRLRNYSAFEDTGWVELKPGLNVVVGLNNAGKSALLAALGPALPDIRHKNPQRHRPGDLKPALVELDLASSTTELRRRLAETGLTVKATAGGPYLEDKNRLRDLIASDIPVTISVHAEAGAQLRYRDLIFSDRINFVNGHQKIIRMSGGELAIEDAGAGRDDTFHQLFTDPGKPAFFFFNAQRFSVARSGFASEKQLTSSASNLPALLAYLVGNHPGLFSEIVDRVREVLPSVRAITVSTEDGDFKILIWSTDDLSIRDLAFDLNNSGTGVSQVLAILTAVIISQPSVIVIDEINSFLHPAATKQLLRIMTLYYSKHQYVVSSHSADVVSFSNNSQLLLIEKSALSSKIRAIPPTDVGEVRSALHHLGVSMADVLGADRIIWVEGATEELVFPDLLRRRRISFESGIRFASVASTGDFSRRGSSKKAVIDLYKKATQAVAPLVRGSVFLLDRETLSDEAVEQVLRQTDGQLTLLNRRCLECFALNAEAIASVIRTESSRAISASEVHDAIDRMGGDRKYGASGKWKRSEGNLSWISHVDAPKLLSDIFTELTANELRFSKTAHTPKIIAATPDTELLDLIDTVESSIQRLQLA